MPAKMPRCNTFILGLTLTTLNSVVFAMNQTTFVWNDINTRQVIRWDGDTAIVQQGSSMQEFECKLNIKSSDVEHAVDSFGVPKSWTTFTYSDEEDLSQKQTLLKEKAENHGIKMEESNRFSIDYNWVINHSERPIANIAKRIRSAARRNNYRSKRELVGCFASFVQSLKYRVPSDCRINDEGETILTAGAMMPLETLSKQWGDCDSKSMLFASLVQSIDLVDVCFIVMDEHLFAGVILKTNPDDQTIRHNDKDWVLIELTDYWPLGRVPQDRFNDVVQGNYKVVELSN